MLSGVGVPNARADDRPTTGMTVRVDYRAPATCPTRTEFLGNVRRYTTKWSLVEGQADRQFRVVLATTEAKAQGTLEIVVGGHQSRRVVSGPSCQTVARGLAVMVALVIDPSASVSESDTGAELGSADEPRRADPTRRTDAVEATPPEQTQGAALAPSRRGDPSATVSSHSTSVGTKSFPTFTFELREELTAAVLRRSLLVLGGFLDVEFPWFGTATGDRRRRGIAILGRPSIGVGFRQSLPREIGVPGGSTEFLWTAGTVRVCPLRFGLLAERLLLAPCVEGSAGILSAEGRGIPLTQITRKRWLDGTVSASAIWRLTGPWVVTGSVGLVVPLLRYRYEVLELGGESGAAARSELVSQAPMTGITAGIGLGLRL